MALRSDLVPVGIEAALLVLGQRLGDGALYWTETFVDACW